MKSIRKAYAAVWFLLAAAPALAQHPPGIASISVCSTNGSGGQGSCPSGSFDTHQLVLGPGGVSVNLSSLNVTPAPEEHSTVFAPGTLGTNQDYLFFLATPGRWTIPSRPATWRP